MPTIKELLEAKDVIAIHEMEKGEVTYDDLMRILHNSRVNKKTHETAKKKEYAKDYLSKADRETFIKLAALLSCLEEVIEAWSKSRNPKQWTTWLKIAKTNIFKVMVEMFRQVPEEQHQKLFKEIAYHRVYIGEYEVKRRGISD